MVFKMFLWLILFGPVQSAVAVSVHHNLQIKIHPQESRLTGIDDMEVRLEAAAAINFILSERADPIEALVNGKPAELTSDGSKHRIPLRADQRAGLIRVRACRRAVRLAYRRFHAERSWA